MMMAVLIVVGIPCLVLILSLAWRFATGPFWLGPNSDPAYQYLMNSLYLADHKVPLYFQHPGIPVQLLGAAIIKLLNLFVPDPLMVEHVLRAPEFYLHAMYAVLIIFYTVTLIALSYDAYRRSGDVMFALLVQMPAFLYLTMCKEEGFILIPANVCPETLLIGLFNLYGLFILRAFFTADKKSSLGTAIGWGMVYGLMVATKFTSLSLFLIPVALLSSFRDRLLFCLYAVIMFILATGPVWSRYPAMWANLDLMLTHTSFRGNGPQGFIAWGSFYNGLIATFFQHWLLMCSALLVLGIVFYNLIVQGSWGRLNKAYYWAGWVGATIILQFLIVAKETAYHYMFPVVGLFGFLWALMYLGSPAKPLLWRRAVLFFIGSSLVFNFIYMWNFYRSSSAMQDFSKEVYGHKQSVICTYYRCSSMPFALVFGDSCFGLEIYKSLIQQLYPRDYAMDIMQFKIVNPQDAFVEDSLAKGQQVFLYGSLLPESSFSPIFDVKLVAQKGNEAVYGVRAAKDKEAFQLFYMAQMALMQGHGQMAYTLGSQAKALGLPVARDFIARLDEIIAKSEAK